MQLLNRIQTGRSCAPPRLMIYGTEGIGKSTFASQTPDPIFIQTEDGLGQIDCHRFPLANSLDDVATALSELRLQPHDYKTIVIDTLDWLELLIWDSLCRQYGVSSIEKVDGGYGKGYVHATACWRHIIDQLSALRNERKMMILLLAHSKIERFEDPEAAAYDRYSPRLHRNAVALVTEWCDAVLFATWKMVVRSEPGSFQRTHGKAVLVGKDGDERILRCIGGPSCIAKNRYGLPNELPLRWSELANCLFENQVPEPEL